MVLIPEALRKKKYPRWINQGESGFIVKDQEEHIKKAPEDHQALLEELGLVDVQPKAKDYPISVAEAAVESDPNVDDWMMEEPAPVQTQKKGKR